MQFWFLCSHRENVARGVSRMYSDFSPPTAYGDALPSPFLSKPFGGYRISTSEGHDKHGWLEWLRKQLFLEHSPTSQTSPSPRSTLDARTFIDQHRSSFAFVGGSIFSALMIWTTKRTYKNYFRRISNSDYVTPRLLRTPNGLGRDGLIIKGFVTSVGDADNFRLFHTPGFGWNIFRKIPKQKSGLKDQTIHIRLAGVDAPELAHFGQPEQPFAKEALVLLKKLVDQKTVNVQLLSKDRYNRIVGMVFVRRWWFSPFRRRNVSLSMVQAGLAAVYRSAGAEYGSLLEQLTAAEARAKKYKLGMWSQSARSFESPRDYKLRHAKDSSHS